MTYLYIYLVGFLGFAAWLSWMLYKDKRDGVSMPWRAIGEAWVAVILWPFALIYVAIVIGWTAWQRRGY